MTNDESAMRTNRSGARYGGVSIALHWLMLLLIAGAYATMEFKFMTKRGSAEREALMAWHYTIGMSVFFLAWLRLLARLVGKVPAIEPAIPAWQERLAQAMHWMLYAMMFGLPLLGWLTLSAKGAPVPFFGLELPPLMGKDEVFRKWFREIHELGGNVGYFLIGLHTVAALYHHYVRRDNTLRLMLPAGTTHMAHTGARAGP
jgi:cytochrome b561